MEQVCRRVPVCLLATAFGPVHATIGAMPAPSFPDVNRAFIFKIKRLLRS